MPSLRNQLLRPAEDPETRWGDPPPPQTGQLPVNALAIPRPANELMQPQPDAPQGPQGSYPQAASAQPSGGDQDRVSSRIPESKRLTFDPHTRQDLMSGLGAMLPQTFKREHNIVEGKYYDEARGRVEDAFHTHANNIRGAEEHNHINTYGLSDLGVLERFVEHAHDNIVGLYRHARKEPWSGEAMRWYDGANKMAYDMAKRFGVSHRQAAAVLAALSPSKDWNQNAELAQRVLRIHANHQDSPVTQAMRDRMQALADQRADAQRAALQHQVDQIRVGQKLSELPNKHQRALFVRTHDETDPERDPGYYIVAPGGNTWRARTKKDDKGRQKDRTLVWQSIPAIANAMHALSAIDPGGEEFRGIISRSLGANHKVRNFYNNIIAPNSRWGDVTADTHAINVAHLLPMGPKHPFVGYGIGTTGAGNPNATGMKGLYGLHHEAYRRAAETISRMEGRPVLPREVQSLTWEAIRNLFEKQHKKVTASGFPLHPAGLSAHGLQYAAHHGLMSHGRAVDALVGHLGGIKPPDWVTGVAGEGEEE